MSLFQFLVLSSAGLIAGSGLVIAIAFGFVISLERIGDLSCGNGRATPNKSRP